MVNLILARPRSSEAIVEVTGRLNSKVSPIIDAPSVRMARDAILSANRGRELAMQVENIIQ